MSELDPSRVHHVQQLHEECGTMPRRKEERGGRENAEQKENVALSREQARIIEKGGAVLLSRWRAISSKTAVHTEVTEEYTIETRL